jgi:hypothetical protein
MSLLTTRTSRYYALPGIHYLSPFLNMDRNACQPALQSRSGHLTELGAQVLAQVKRMVGPHLAVVLHLYCLVRLAITFGVFGHP